MFRAAFTILYMNPTKPFKLQCQQKKSQQITKVDSELNNTSNKTNVEVKDLNLQWLRYNYPANDEKQLYSWLLEFLLFNSVDIQIVFNGERSLKCHKKSWKNLSSFQMTNHVTCLELTLAYYFAITSILTKTCPATKLWSSSNFISLGTGFWPARWVEKSRI